MTELFIDRTNYRTLDRTYSGDILVWDIDKTYLDTRFSSLGGLLGIVMDAAVDKQAIPGSVPLIRALRRGPGTHNALVPLYFVSGSPPQLRAVLERKMILDGVDFDGITFKDQFGLIKARRPRAIVEQVGYKLCALLLYRKEMPDQARWIFFGDDVEKDAQVFSLFGEVCAGLRGEALRRRMKELGTAENEIHGALLLSDAIAVGPDPVERIFIRLEKHKDPERIRGPHVVAVRTFLQAALVLAQMGRVRKESIAAVADDLRLNHIAEDLIARDLDDAIVRLGVPEDLVAYARR